MKKLFALIFAAVLGCSLFGFAACNSEKTIVVGASQTPHAEILEEARKEVEALGYKLKIKVFDDYITPNTALEEGKLDANYFQHTPYLNTFNEEYKTHLAAVTKVHYEPFGVYGKDVTKEDYAANKTGRTILIPNDGSNRTRALFVLRDEGFITLTEGAKPTDNLTLKDIVESNGNTVKDIDAQTVAQILAESDKGTLGVINGNYALQAGLRAENALAFENAEGDAAQLYANVIAVKQGNENSDKTVALVKAVLSKTVFDYINATYNGAVQPVFTLTA